MVIEVGCVCTVPPSILLAWSVVTSEQASLPFPVAVAVMVGVTAVLPLPVVAVGVVLPFPFVVPLPPQAANKNNPTTTNTGNMYVIFSPLRATNFMCFCVFFIEPFHNLSGELAAHMIFQKTLCDLRLLRIRRNHM